MFKLLNFKRTVIISAAALAAMLTAGLGVYGFSRYIKKVGTRGVMRGVGTVMYTVGVTIRTLASDPQMAPMPQVAVAAQKK